MRHLRLGDVTHETDAAHRTAILSLDGRRLKLEPAIGVIGVTHAEVGADLATGSLLHRPQRQAEPFPVGRMHVLQELVDLDIEFTRRQPERLLDDLADLDLVAPARPLPHGRRRRRSMRS